MHLQNIILKNSLPPNCIELPLDLKVVEEKRKDAASFFFLLNQNILIFLLFPRFRNQIEVTEKLDN